MPRKTGWNLKSKLLVNKYKVAQKNWLQ